MLLEMMIEADAPGYMVCPKRMLIEKFDLKRISGTSRKSHRLYMVLAYYRGSLTMSPLSGSSYSRLLQIRYRLMVRRDYTA